MLNQVLSLIFGCAVMLSSSVAQSASVYNCSQSQHKCVVKVAEGIIGDRVQILDEKARVIASGRIVKKRGAYAVIRVKDSSKSIRKGYPVIVDLEARGSDFQWAASFSNKD